MPDTTPPLPDFRSGFSIRDLPDGGKVLGRVDQEEVLLVRTGDAVFAVGPHCTHYHGPLVARRRRHHSVPMAPRLLQPAHRRGGACPSAGSDSLLARRAHRRLGLRQRTNDRGARTCTAIFEFHADVHRHRRGRRRRPRRRGRPASGPTPIRATGSVSNTGSSPSARVKLRPGTCWAIENDSTQCRSSGVSITT
jgi:hypothetical protein